MHKMCSTVWTQAQGIFVRQNNIVPRKRAQDVQLSLDSKHKQSTELHHCCNKLCALMSAQ